MSGSPRVQNAPRAMPANLEAIFQQPSRILNRKQAICGAVTLVRHGKPALSRKCWLTSSQYADWWARYEIGGIEKDQIVPQDLLMTVGEADVLFCSTRLRAQETAQRAAMGLRVEAMDVFVEAPLPPPAMPPWFKMPPRFWGVLARICWHMASRYHNQETRSQAVARADRAANILIEQAQSGRNVVVFAHGYFNHMTAQALVRKGWAITRDQGFKYWCQRRFERRAH